MIDRFSKHPKLLLGAMVFIQLFLMSGSAVAELRSIQEFNAYEDKWPKLIDTRWNLEGRYSAISDRNMYFRNCKLTFVLEDGVSKPSSKISVVEIQGRLKLDRSEKLYFSVESLKPYRNDSENLFFKRGAINTTNPQEWYDVAEWGKNRAEFYRDADLLEEIQDLYLNGLLTEQRALDREDVAGHFRLAEKSKDLKLGEKIYQELIHQGLQIQSDLIGKRKSDPATLLNQLSKKLPGALSPLESLPEKLAESYRKTPIAEYDAADAEQRKVLHRIFYVDEMVRQITKDAKQDGSNGIEISERLIKELPEKMDLAAMYYDKQLAYQISRVDVMTRNEMLELSALLVDENRADQAITVKQKWLTSREKVLAEDGARGYVELAQDWEELLGDEEKATKYYLLAIRRDGDYHDAQVWLEKHGYILANGKWVLEVDAPPTENVVMQRAIRDGRVTVGMTSQQALEAMASKPDSILRFAANGTTSELWIYESSQTSIRFTSNLRGNSQVVAIQKLDK